MPRPPVAALMLVALASGCSSGLNPMTWTGDSPQSIAPEETHAAQTGDRPLIPEVSALSVEPMEGGVIVRATGLPPGQGYWDAALVPSPGEPVDGVMTYRFVARPPDAATPGTAWSREIEAAAFLSAYDLDSIREIVVQGAANQRVSRR